MVSLVCYLLYACVGMLIHLYIFAYTFKKQWKDKAKINNKMDNYRREKRG